MASQPTTNVENISNSKNKTTNFFAHIIISVWVNNTHLHLATETISPSDCEHHHQDYSPWLELKVTTDLLKASQSWASQLISLQVLPISFTPFSTVLLHEPIGLPHFLFFWWFPSKCNLWMAGLVHLQDMAQPSPTSVSPLPQCCWCLCACWPFHN